ncbi:MAG TPA: hypothetical protein PJ991_08610 [Kiritimatiellia bacterium]|nr:hypothetical protein [Kiritimatiellia bacterium]
MKKITFLLAALALVGATPVRADLSALSTTVTLGYDSRYVLYGYRLSRHLYKGDIYLTYPLNDKVSLWGGAWYGYLTDGTYHEVDVYAGVDYAVTESIFAGIAYSLFNYIEVPFPTSDQAHEISAHVTYFGDQFSLALQNHYDSEAEGNLLRAIGDYSLPITEQLSAGLNVEAGYAFRYFISGNLWNHAQVKLSAPYRVNDAFTITPFIARSIPLAAIDDFEQYETYGGISCSLTF